MPLAERLAAYFRLTKSVKLVNLWTNSDSSQYLSYSPAAQTITYQVDLGLRPSAYQGKNPPFLKAAQDTATQFLANFPEWRDLVLEKSGVEYLTAGDAHYEPGTPDLYHVINIPFSRSVDGFPIRVAGTLVPEVTLQIGQNNSITRLIVSAQNISSLAPLKTATVLPPSEAVKLVASGQTQLIHSNYQDAAMFTLDSLPPVTIYAVSLEYRLEPASGLLAPYYTLTGTYQQSNEPPVTLYFVLKAVSD